MKKIITLICLALLGTGCTVKKVTPENRDEIISVALNRDIKLYNRVSNGYKYYLPKGISMLDYKDYNETLYTNSSKYYLYVDIVSYHYKKEKTYMANNTLYYSKIINNNGKKGYIEVENARTEEKIRLSIDNIVSIFIELQNNKKNGISLEELLK